MSITEMYAAFEIEYSDICEEEFFDKTNFGESMELSAYMEGHGGGFDIRDHEQETTYDSNGVEVELRGFNEEEDSQMNIYVQEILDVLGPDQGEGAGPIDLETNFLLDDYIMFRTTLYGVPRWEQNPETGKWKKVRHDTKFNLDPVAAINMAEDIFDAAAVRYREDFDHIQKRAGDILRLTEEKGLDRGIYARYLNWAMRTYNINLAEGELKGFEFHFEPVLDNQTQVNSDTMPGHMAADLDYHDWEQHRLKMESRYWDCFNDDGSKQLCTEEFHYIIQKKDERIQRAKEILSWIEKHDAKEVAEMFRSGGKFKKYLQNNRTLCLKPTGSYRTTFKSPYELWLTKEQVTTITMAAEKKQQNT